MAYLISGTHAGGAKAARPASASGKFYGLLELDAAGTVLYSRAEPDGAASGAPAPDLTGRNFYTEVAPFSNVGEFRHQLDLFEGGLQPASSLDFICQYEDGPLTVRLLLTRIRERVEQNTTKSILVHIRRSQSSSTSGSPDERAARGRATPRGEGEPSSS